MPKRLGFKRSFNRSRAYARSRLPPGLRLLAGILLILAGLFGFLPVLGFWMIPLGLSIAALDVRPLWRRWKRRQGAGLSPPAAPPPPRGPLP